MIDISKLSRRYSVRILEDSDIDMILDICRRHTVFYRYTDARPARENILDDMRAVPLGKTLSDKYYFGFFDHQMPVAVMELVDGYPESDIAYIGFFMMNPEYQGKQLGTAIITEAVAYLQSTGKKAVRLAIDKGNPQSSHFWMKNGFEVISEADVNGWPKLVAERKLKGRIIAACGNDCSACPRYMAHPFEKTEEELQHTAELWIRIGYRDHVVSNEEISCSGCKPENWCRYHVIKCCEDRRIGNCSECSAYPCENMKECFQVTMSFEPKCRMVCSPEEYVQVRKAFFEKEKNLDELRDQIL